MIKFFYQVLGTFLIIAFVTSCSITEKKEPKEIITKVYEEYTPLPIPTEEMDKLHCRLVFQYGKFELGEKEKHELEKIISSLKTQYKNNEVFIKPFTMNYEVNEFPEIDKKRVKSIRDYLIKSGIQDFKISLDIDTFRGDFYPPEGEDGGYVWVMINDDEYYFEKMTFMHNVSDITDTTTLYFNMNVFKEHPDWIVLIHSGYYKSESGFDLGFKRAINVKEYFIKNGIDKSRIFLWVEQEPVEPRDSMWHGLVMGVDEIGKMSDPNMYSKEKGINVEYIEKKYKDYETFKVTQKYEKKYEKEKEKNEHPELYRLKWYNPGTWF